MSDSERSEEQWRTPRRRRRSHRPAGPGSTTGQQSASAKGSSSASSQAGAGSTTGDAHRGGAPGEPGRSRGRRRRGGRGRGGRGRSGRGGTPTTRATEAHPTTPHARSADPEQRPAARSESSGRGGKTASGSATGSTGSGKDGSPRAQARQNSGGGQQGRSGRSGSRARARGDRSGGRPQPSHLRTVRETSAGGLVVRGLAVGLVDRAGDDPAHFVTGEGVAVDLSRLDVALIGRLDRRGRMLWSMPKGHIESGETLAETARREVVEETGANGTVLALLGSIDYWFVAEGKRIHKTVHHHLIRYDDGELCDEDPEVTEVAWVPFLDLPTRLAYPDERRLVDSARRLLPGLALAERDGTSPTVRPADPVDPARRAPRGRDGGFGAETGTGT